MKRLMRYLNPFEHLGDKHYPVLFPFLTLITVTALLEFFIHTFLKDPAAVGIFAIFIYIFLIIYFAFRAGLRAGVLAACFTVSYYLYIIYTRNYSGQQFVSAIETTVALGVVYILLASIIGILKQRLDQLIEREADGRKRLQAILQQLPVGVVITNNNGVVETANKKSESILGRKIPLGFQMGSEALVTVFRDGKEVPASKSMVRQVLATGKSIINREYMILRSDKKRVYVDASGSVIRNKSGDVIAAATIINDITQQKEMEKRKDDFVNMASHELKTPITSMKLYIDSLMIQLKQGGDKKAIRTVDRVKYQTERLQKLVSDLLDVSRLQTGKLTFSKEAFDLNELVRETVDELKGAAADKTLHFSSKGLLTVSGDKFRIYQVLTNLITNAIKYSPDQGKIYVRLKKENGKAVVSVQDFGIGINKDQLTKIFDRLYQVTDDNEKTFPGFGMGLYISKEIIRRHRGTIWVESEKGKGSTFYFSLPVS